ncbi:hypothetical protein CBL_04030 [Carabus blaptoides fortunei]
MYHNDGDYQTGRIADPKRSETTVRTYVDIGFIVYILDGYAYKQDFVFGNHPLPRLAFNAAINKRVFRVTFGSKLSRDQHVHRRMPTGLAGPKIPPIEYIEH